MKKLLFAIFMAVISVSSFAQTDAIRVGYGLIPDKGMDAYLNSFNAEYTRYITLSGDTKLSTGINFDYNWRGKDGVKLRMMDLSVPVNVTKFIRINDSFIISPYIGLHGKYYTYGEMKVGNEDKFDLFSKKEMMNNQYKRFQFGGQIGVDFIGDHIILGLEGDMDFTKLHPDAGNHKRIMFKIGTIF